MNEYLKLFIDDDYPYFIDKYLQTKTLNRIKFVSQFCGADYTRLYSPLFFYTRFDHSLVVAHMTWHFTHDKTEIICALLHDVGTPCFAHCIDYVLGDYLNQESSEKSIFDIIKNDSELLSYLKEDNIDLNDLYALKEEEVINIFNSHFKSWEYFSECTDLVRTNKKPNNFFISFETKKRYVICLIETKDGVKRIIDVSLIAKEIYESLENYQDSKYAYVKKIKNIY